MPNHLTARLPLDTREERQVRTLAHRAHAPADWIVHAQMVARSWDGLPTGLIAEELGCQPQTVREHLHACNERGLDGVGMKPGSGRTPRLTEQERTTLLPLVQRPPPAKPPTNLPRRPPAPGGFRGGPREHGGGGRGGGGGGGGGRGAPGGGRAGARSGRDPPPPPPPAGDLPPPPPPPPPPPRGVLPLAAAPLPRH